MVYRIYVEKKPGFDGEAQGLLHELVDLVGIQNLTGLRLLNSTASMPSTQCCSSRLCPPCSVSRLLT